MTRPAPAKPSPRQRGFSLIELLVAFVILSLSLSLIYGLFSGGARSLRQAREWTEAAAWAETKLATLGVAEPLREGRFAGALARGYHWQLQVSRADADPRPDALALYRLQLGVRWHSAGRDHQLQFETLRLPASEGRARP